MANFLFFKKKDKKQFIAVCPKSLENCFIAACCEGCIDLKQDHTLGNSAV